MSKIFSLDSSVTIYIVFFVLSQGVHLSQVHQSFRKCINRLGSAPIV